MQDYVCKYHQLFFVEVIYFQIHIYNTSIGLIYTTIPNKKIGLIIKALRLLWYVQGYYIMVTVIGSINFS